MRVLRVLARSTLLAAVVLLAGCQTYTDPNPKQAFVFPGMPGGPFVTPAQSDNATPVNNPGLTSSQPPPPRGGVWAPVPVNSAGNPVPLSAQPPNIAAPTPVNPGAAYEGSSSIFQKGEEITVTFSDIPPPGLPPLKAKIPDDGKISLPFNISVTAVGKTPAQLEEEIRNKYVPQFYVRLTVTVKPEERFIYVGGEVKVNSRQFYSGEMTVTRAIHTAGGFTDFADRKRIELLRRNGETFKVNYEEVIKDPRKDPPVFPNDQIIVPKRRPLGIF